MNSYMKYCMHCIAFIDDEKLTSPMQLCLMHPFGSSSSDCALFTCALIVSPLQRGYNLSVRSNSSFGHSQTGQSSVLHIVVAAISKPSMLRKCQKQRPKRTFLSANRKYLSSEHRVLIWAMTGSIQRWYSSRRRCLCHFSLLLVNAPGFKMGSSPSGLHA